MTVHRHRQATVLTAYAYNDANRLMFSRYDVYHVHRLIRNPLTTTDIWFLSSVGKGTISVHSRVK